MGAAFALVEEEQSNVNQGHAAGVQQDSHQRGKQFGQRHPLPPGEAELALDAVVLAQQASGVVPVVIADDWALPFEEIIDWKEAAVRVGEAQLETVPETLAALPLDRVCALRRTGFEAYTRYLAGPAQWNRAIEEVLAKREAAGRGGGGGGG